MATCPECEYDEIDAEDLEEGDSLNCPECGRGLVVSGAGDLELADDDDDDEDDDDFDEDAEEESVEDDEDGLDDEDELDEEDE